MAETEAVLIALRRIIRATDQNSKRLSRSAGLTIPQSVLMRAIAQHPRATLRFLTETVSLSQATVTTIVDRLEERGLLVRRRNTEDKRVVNVELTERGEALLRDSPPPLQQEFRERFARLPGEQQDLIVGALDTIASMMDARELDASPILTLGQMADSLQTKAKQGAGPRKEEAPDGVSLRIPESTDGANVHGLIRICPPLDQNSMYCNLLQCSHFRETSIVAERDGRMVGFISGYLPPRRRDTLFVWQVAVHPDARGLGLGRRMLDGLFDRDCTRAATHLETSVTPDNNPSMKLFESFARSRAAPLKRETLFDRQLHFAGQHDTEVLLRIGPFAGPSSTSAEAQ